MIDTHTLDFTSTADVHLHMVWERIMIAYVNVSNIKDAGKSDLNDLGDWIWFPPSEKLWHQKYLFHSIKSIFYPKWHPVITNDLVGQIDISLY